MLVSLYTIPPPILLSLVMALVYIYINDISLTMDYVRVSDSGLDTTLYEYPFWIPGVTSPPANEY